MDAIRALKTDLFRGLLLFLFVLIAGAAPADSSEVRILRFSGVINPIAAEYLGGSIAKIGHDRSADLIVIILDTPGGLDASMRLIVKEILASKIPVAVYVAPSGSRAASAGTFIAMAAHISAMAPGTSQGSAHPVTMGEKMDDTMSKKVENDAAAFLRSIAFERGRNAEWAEKAVRESVSLDERAALRENVIDIVAKDIKDLLRQIDGRKVKTGKVDMEVSTQSPRIIYIDMSQRQKLLDTISNPTVAYILLMLGFYGLFFELANPGVILPGVIGGICLIMGFYAMESLPVNYAALFMLLLGVILFIAELYVTSHGALTVGGVIALVLGGLLLIESPADYMKVQVLAVVPAAVALGGLILIFIVYGLFFKPRKLGIGAEGLAGLEGMTITGLHPTGKVRVEGEIWDARCDSEPLEKGSPVKVIRKEGRLLLVKRVAVLGEKE